MFRDSLAKVVDNVEGGIAGLLMGFDGIPVETYARPAPVIDINSVGMEFSFVLTQVRKVVEGMEIGAMEEVAIRTDRLLLIIRVLSPDYFVALALVPGGNSGKGRYLLRSIAPAIQTELA